MKAYLAWPLLLLAGVLQWTGDMCHGAAARLTALAKRLLPIILALLILNAFLVGRTSEAEAYLSEGAAQ